LPPGDLERLAEERIRFLERVPFHNEENLGPQPVELGIVEVLSQSLRARDAGSERAHGIVVAPGLPEALSGHREPLRRSSIRRGRRQSLDGRRGARLALPPTALRDRRAQLLAVRSEQRLAILQQPQALALDLVDGLEVSGLDPLPRSSRRRRLADRRRLSLV